MTLKCRYCQTESRKDGQPFKIQGQLNLHEYHCKMKNFNREDRQEDREECKHEFRFLNLNQSIEKNAYSYGFKEVCIKCQDLK